jgi:spore coat polysaccharide biosynthesis predicted glycosyltransferase SpsG
VDSEVIIWAEGGADLGMGHIVRCVNIATALKKLGVKPSFIINPDEATQKRLLIEGFAFITNSLDAEFTESSFDAFPRLSVLVIDTKKDVSNIVKLLKARGVKVLLVDNNTSAGELADKVVIPSVVAPMNAEATKDESDKFFSGADYLIIGDNYHNALRERSAISYALPFRVLVTFGAADINGITSQVVDALCTMKDLDITVVIGEMFTKRDPYAYSAGCAHVKCVSGINDLAPLMGEAHIGITANGTSLYEMAFMGIPSIVIANFERDLCELETYEKLGISKGLGLYSDVTAEAIQRALAGFSAKGYLEESSKRASKLTDGLGASRVAELVVTLMEEND